MKVVIISPFIFNNKSVIGGGERYAYELAKNMSDRADVSFVSFAQEDISNKDGRLTLEYINRKYMHLLKFLKEADVIHCFQTYNFVTDIAVILGKTFKNKVFITDIGGGSKYALSYHLPILRRSDAFLLISEYSRNLWRQTPVKLRPDNLHVIYGGVDINKFSPDNNYKSKTVLFVGRLLPHKGVDYLIDSIGGMISLDIVGNIYDKNYFSLLKDKSINKKVNFYLNTDDNELVQRYRNSFVTVVPSVYKDCYGNYTAVPELLGMVALESMSCGTPVIVSDVGSLPEIVEDGVTGFIVPPNNPSAISNKIEYLISNPEIARSMGIQGRKRIVERFTWDVIVNRCLEIYAHGQ